MIDKEIKAYFETQLDLEIRSHLHDGNYSQRINLFDIFGFIETLSAAPTGTPSNIYGQFKIYNGVLYYYDFVSGTWLHDGPIATVLVAPSGAPANGSLSNQLKIFNGQLYYYDFTNSVWQHAGNGGYSVAKNTNGTSPVNVFGAGGAPFPLVVTAVYLICRDNVAGNITLKQAANTVCTIAKGTVAGVMTGATGLSNDTYAKGDACTIVSSTAGDATVIINFNA